MRLTLTSIFLSLALSGNAGVPLDSLFVEAAVKADNNSMMWLRFPEDIIEKLAESGNKLSNRTYSNDTIVIICNYALDCDPWYYIFCPDIKIGTDLTKFWDASLTYSRMDEASPEMEWIENWEPDSLKKYGVRDKNVQDGILKRYAIRYIINGDTVLSNMVKYAPFFNYHKWDKWRERKRTSAGNRE